MKRRLAPYCLLLLLLVPASLRAADLPPITDEERSLTAVPGEPNAPSVVLLKKAEFLMMGYGPGGNQSSSVRVQVRRKILTEEGKSNGEVSIAHSDDERLLGFKGRTVLPDGRVIPVPADAKFVRKTSASRHTFNTSVAFPSVQVGSIVEYEYELRFDSIFYLEPWYFSEDVPVRYSEIVFRIPLDVRIQAWSRAPQRVQIQKGPAEKTSLGYSMKAWAENLPSVPDDPYGPPFNDLAAQMILLPSAIRHLPLLESWPKTSAMIGGYYDQVRRRDSGLEKKAREIAPSGSPREQAEKLYRFVRDQIATEPFIGVIVSPDDSLAKILSEARGDRAEKALLLQSLLKAVKIDSRLVWAGDRSRGAIDTQLPNPRWFDTVLVLVELDGKQTFLDPSDRALAFGQLRYGYEGTPALIPDKKKPEGLVLPETPYDQNLRRAEVELALDAKGRLAGTGTLVLTGHHAWEKIDWKDDAAQETAAWKDWLAERYRDFQITDVKAVGGADERKVTVTWAMAQREEEVLGDEATIAPAAPWVPPPSRWCRRPRPGVPACFSTTPTARRCSSGCTGPRGGRRSASPRPRPWPGPPAPSPPPSRSRKASAPCSIRGGGTSLGASSAPRRITRPSAPCSGTWRRAMRSPSSWSTARLAFAVVLAAAGGRRPGLGRHGAGEGDRRRHPAGRLGRRAHPAAGAARRPQRLREVVAVPRLPGREPRAGEPRGLGHPAGRQGPQGLPPRPRHGADGGGRR